MWETREQMIRRGERSSAWPPEPRPEPYINWDALLYRPEPPRGLFDPCDSCEHIHANQLRCLVLVERHFGEDVMVPCLCRD